MTAFELLSPPIKRFIRDKRWEEFRPIQKAAIVKILSTQNNYILAARTASGKTEAAFLPILSKVDFSESGIQVLYISPLIALINDQFARVEELCKYMDVRVTKWHGEASRARKRKLIKDPSGILLITPESIEAMFVNQPYNIGPLFHNLKFVIIDEIHSFLGTHRGTQLKSLLWRISQRGNAPLRFIGLSATLGDYYESVKNFFGSKQITKVLRDGTPQPIEESINFFQSAGKELPLALLKKLYLETQSRKALIFPNSRARVEEVAVKLKKIAEKNNGHTYYFAHHSSVNRALREFIEQFVKTNQRYNYAIACTSTLELGIDIGSVDLVVQVDSTFSVASLAQRLGRSGRKKGTKSQLLICATENWTLLQSIACFELLKEDFVEPLKDIIFPIDILFHQILSIVQENSGLHKNALFQQLLQNPTFQSISKEEVISLLKYMIKKDYLENLNDELIIGVGAEQLMSGRTFYTVFQTPVMYQVVFKNKKIGEIPPSPQVVPDENIFLAASMWKIKEVDLKKGKVHVQKAMDGKNPLFFGTGGIIHPRIRQKMLEIIAGCSLSSNCSEAAQDQINDLKTLFKDFQITDTTKERPVFVQEDKLSFYTFAGTKVNQTLFFALKNMLEVDCYLKEQPQSLLEFPLMPASDFQVLITESSLVLPKLEQFLKGYLTEKEQEFPFSKWGAFLPIELKCKVLLNSYFDVGETIAFLSELKLLF